jgi:hypothetical protein
MGAEQSRGDSEMEAEEARTFFDDPAQAMEVIKRGQHVNHALAPHSIFPDTEEIREERKTVQEKLMNDQFDEFENRAIGIVLANVIGDALGAPLEVIYIVTYV